MYSMTKLLIIISTQKWNPVNIMPVLQSQELFEIGQEKKSRHIRYASKTKSEWKAIIFTTSFKFIDFFSIYKSVTIISIIMQTQTKLCLYFSKINIEVFLLIHQSFH